jgi:hypothetical protein
VGCFFLKNRNYGERAQLFQVCADNCDEIVGRFFRRLRIPRHVVADVIFHQFSHQTIDGSAGSRQALQHFRALFVIVQGSEYSLELANDFLCAVYQIDFF